MEFLKNNARGIIISLLVAGAIVGIASVSSDDTDTNNDAETSQSENNEESVNNENESTTAEDENGQGEGSENNENASSDEENSEEQPTVNNEDENFTSTTVNGDSQTVVVRRIVERYLSGSEAELSAEQKLYVETNLVNDLGRSDFVAVGEEIALAESTVAQRVEEAQNLSEATIERWAQYL